MQNIYSTVQKCGGERGSVGSPGSYLQPSDTSHQAWELRMEKSAEKWGAWGPQKASSVGPGGNAPGGGQGASPPEAEAF